MKIVEVEQRSEEWKALRRSKITATDAPIIFGASPWRNEFELLEDKILGREIEVTDRMQRGIDLEPIALREFNKKMGVICRPQVVVKDYMMASLDGLSECRKIAVEIKCPSKKVHTQALCRKIPAHYLIQMQHQMHVAELEKIAYFSFDGSSGIILWVHRDQEFIDVMIQEEEKFYKILENVRSVYEAA